MYGLGAMFCVPNSRYAAYGADAMIWASAIPLRCFNSVVILLAKKPVSEAGGSPPHYARGHLL